MTDEPRPRRFRLDLGAQRAERDVNEEIEFHIGMRARKLADAGLDPVAARAEAERQFGDPRCVRDECVTIDRARVRAAERANHLSDLRQDIRFAWRTMRANKAATLTMVVILALGMGANTATFTLIDALLLRTLPIPHPERLVSIGDPRRTGSLSEGTPHSDIASYPLYADVRDENHVLSGLYATGRTGRVDVRVAGDPASAGADSGTAGDEPEHPRARLVSGNYFSVLRVPAVAGRTFTGDEDRAPGADPVVVISHDWWQQRFAGARSAIGRSITINGAPLTIIGVAPPGFTGDIVGQPTDIWIPLMMQPAIMPHRDWLADRQTSWLLLMGRLKPGVSLEQARTQLSEIERRSLVAHASANDVGGVERGLRRRPVQVENGARGFSYYRAAYAPALFTLMTAVGLVLLVVCANVANLMLARATARGREMSVRMALGAGRSRLVRQLVTESMLIAAIGGMFGLLIAWWGSLTLLRLAGGGPTPIPLDVHLDGRILAFTAILSIVTAVLFGVAPALRATRVELGTALRTQGRGVAGTAGRPGRLPLGKLLVVAQVALSLLLLVGTGMLVRSTRRLQQADVGMARDKLLISRVDAERSGYTGPRLIALMHDLTARLSRVPGVAAVSLSENGIFSGTESGTTLQVEGFVAHADSDTLVAYDDVGAGYFHTIGAHLLQGRDFEDRDNESGSKVVVVNASMARFFFPNGSAIGHHIQSDSASWTIVGVVADVEEQSVRNPPVRRVYFPTVQMSQQPGEFYLEVRATGDPARLAVPVRRALHAADATLTVLSADALDDLIRDSISQDRLVAQVVSFFGLLALVLAALGLYGVMAYATLRRTSEFGLRIALGARGGDVTRMVLREALLLVAAGALVGVPVALLATRLLRSQLFGIGLFDAPSVVLAIGVLGVSAAVAAWLPAMRAARVSPLEALRVE